MKHKKNIEIPKLPLISSKRNGRESRKEKCIRCGLRWIVSEKATISRRGYVCPRCERKERE